MAALKWLAYICWAFAALIVFLVGVYTASGLIYEYEFTMGLAVAGSVSLSGVLFFGFHRIIELLSDIRDSLAPKGEPKVVAPPQVPAQAQPAQGPTRSIAEIAADLNQMKAKLT